MDRLQAMRVFTRVVDSGNFSRAADTLDLSPASVTVIIQNLEAFLKVRLLQRTTRQLNLTPEGSLYYEQCIRILADIEETETACAHPNRKPSGRLRIDTPGTIGKMILIPSLDRFREQYPDIDLTIGFGDRPLDMIQEGVDCVVRLGTLMDSTLVAKRIGMLRRVTVASPEYLGRYGMPTEISHLERHVGVKYVIPGAIRGPDMVFTENGQTFEINMRSSLAVNDAEGHLACGLTGLGIIQCAEFLAVPHIRAGDLKELLPHCRPTSIPVSIMYPHNRHVSRAVRVFVDWISELFEKCSSISKDSRNPKSANLLPELGQHSDALIA
jgi:LysR family transcriptional regulator, regulator for bpeEF and oprC